MSTTVVMPPLGESVLEGTVGKWLVQEGQRVERDQPVVEILTDKTDSEIPAPAAGLVLKLLVKEGDTVPIGAKLLEIDESASAAVQAAPPAASSSTSGQTATEAQPASAGEPGRASPAVRKLAREMDVDLGAIEGTGQGGVITREDVLRAGQPNGGKAEAQQGSARPASPPPAPAPAPRATSP